MFKLIKSPLFCKYALILNLTPANLIHILHSIPAVLKSVLYLFIIAYFFAVTDTYIHHVVSVWCVLNWQYSGPVHLQLTHTHTLVSKVNKGQMKRFSPPLIFVCQCFQNESSVCVDFSHHLSQCPRPEHWPTTSRRSSLLSAQALFFPEAGKLRLLYCTSALPL